MMVRAKPMTFTLYKPIQTPIFLLNCYYNYKSVIFSRNVHYHKTYSIRLVTHPIMLIQPQFLDTFITNHYCYFLPQLFQNHFQYLKIFLYLFRRKGKNIFPSFFLFYWKKVIEKTPVMYWFWIPCLRCADGVQIPRL